jgi:hypothetical protein
VADEVLGWASSARETGPAVGDSPLTASKMVSIGTFRRREIGQGALGTHMTLPLDVSNGTSSSPAELAVVPNESFGPDQADVLAGRTAVHDGGFEARWAVPGRVLSEWAGALGAGPWLPRCGAGGIGCDRAREPSGG